MVLSLCCSLSERGDLLPLRPEMVLHFCNSFSLSEKVQSCLLGPGMVLCLCRMLSVPSSEGWTASLQLACNGNSLLAG